MATELDRQAILEIARRHGARGVRLFGSVLHGTQRPDSDLDLLVELEPGRDLIDLVELKRELEAKLNRRVDVLTENALSPYIRDDVLREARPL
jgi:predicted nucleotidyltransferase